MLIQSGLAVLDVLWSGFLAVLKLVNMDDGTFPDLLSDLPLSIIDLQVDIDSFFHACCILRSPSSLSCEGGSVNGEGAETVGLVCGG